jgi:hypothetical protein
MTNTPSNPAADVAYVRSLYETQLRLNGTLVNELQDMKLDLQERDRKIADIYSRLEAQGAMDKTHIELLELWADRLSLLESLILAMLEDQEEREAFARQVQPLRFKSGRYLRHALKLADEITAPPAQPLFPPPQSVGLSRNERRQPRSGHQRPLPRLHRGPAGRRNVA